ncbi:MAG: hypothetical protein ACLFSB_00440 [Chitinispirillaceae bacterium]
MNINPVSGGNMYRPDIGRAGRKQKAAPRTRKQPPQIDSCQPSGASKTDRGRLLDVVKKRISSGYYQSKEVLDDLSDSFAKAFDQRI